MDAAPSPPAPARIAGGRPRDWRRENHRRRRLAEQHDLIDVNERLQLELAVAQAEAERAAFEIALVRAGEEHRAQEREAASKMKIIQQELARAQEELERRDRRIQGLEAAHEREIARVRQASEVEIVQKKALVKAEEELERRAQRIRAMEAEDAQRMEPMSLEELLDNLRGGG